MVRSQEARDPCPQNCTHSSATFLGSLLLLAHIESGLEEDVFAHGLALTAQYSRLAMSRAALEDFKGRMSEQKCIGYTKCTTEFRDLILRKDIKYLFYVFLH